MDSKDFEILSFEQLDQFKRERVFLRNKVEGARRQYALEKKMHAASMLMNKLGPSGAEHDSRRKRPSFLGRRSSSAVPVEDPTSTSFEKVDQLGEDVKALESRLQEVERRILQHTAGILQFTHKGLKKNVRKNELPRSPESMASQNRSISGGSDFDERSLYQVPDYVHDFHHAASRSSRRVTKDVHPIEDIAVRLHALSAQLHAMVQQVVLTEHFEPPPEPTDDNLYGRVGAQIQAHLTYLDQGLEALASAQGRHISASPLPAESSEQLQNLTSKLHGMLERTNSVSKSPIVAEDEPQANDLNSQLAYSAIVLERLTQRIDALLDQKDILTRQIQQQRELNSKSDAQRDAHIRDLTEELEDAKKLQAASEKEMQQSNDQIELLMEQLDRAKQSEQLLEQQRGMNDNKALEAERTARKESETKLMKELESKQHVFTEMQADHDKIEHDFELKSQYHIQQLNEANNAKEQVELYLQQKNEQLEAVNSEMKELKSQVVQLQSASAANEQLELKIRQKDEELEALDVEMKELESHVMQMQKTSNAKEQAELHLRQRVEELEVMAAGVKGMESQVAHLETTNAAKEQAELLLRQKSEALDVANAQVENLKAQMLQLQTANTAREQLEDQAKRKDEDMEALHSEMREMESQVVQLQTELTMTKAELDASYGSRAQRAADASMNPEVKKQIDVLNEKNAQLEQQLDVLTQAHETKGLGSAELQNKVNALQKELKDTIEDYEVMTKASIEFEKEREQLEATIDQVRDRCQTLEAQINEDQVKWLGVKGTLPPETTSTMVLKNEFKKMMRDSRAESVKVIRVS